MIISKRLLVGGAIPCGCVNGSARNSSRQRFNPRCRLLAALLQHRDELGLRAWLLLFGLHLPDHRGKLKPSKFVRFSLWIPANESVNAMCASI
jgi:hypothetical protein